MLVDRNNIMENHIKESNKEDLTSLLDNYFENLLQSDEKVIHSDLVTQIIENNKDRISGLIIKNLDNFLKQKKLAIRNNIKKNVFKIDDLINISNSYGSKISNFISFLESTEKTNILKVSSLHLFDNIISDPPMIAFLKTRLSNFLEENSMNIIKMENIISMIQRNNQELNPALWFQMLFSSAVQDTVEEIATKPYPVPTNQNSLINLVTTLEHFNKMYNYLYKIKYDVKSVINSSFPFLTANLLTVFTTSSLKEISTILTNYKKVFSNLFVLGFDITKEVVVLCNKHKTFTVENLTLFFDCLAVVVPLLHNNMNREIVFKKISELFATEDILNIILADVTKFKSMSKFFNTIKEKDKLIDQYNKNLVQRILHRPFIEDEKKNFEILQDIFGDKLMFKTNKIIKDVENTLDDLTNFHCVNVPSLKYKNLLNLVTTSYNWDFNQAEGFYNTGDDKQKVFQGEIFKLMSVYDCFYKQKYIDKRKINWYLHFGEIVFEYKNVEYKMMPLQFMVIEYIMKFKTVSKNELLALNIFQNYNDEFKQSIIGSMILGGILKLDRNEISMGSTPITVDYIKLFFSTTNYDSIWEKKRQDQFTLSREDILKTNINHYVKTAPMSKDDLFKIISEKLTIFTPDINMYEDVLHKMVTDDYISVEKGVVTKLFY
jgi:hypothetical protein